MIPTAVTLAFVLEKITLAMKQNWKFQRLCSEIWAKYDNPSKVASIILSKKQAGLKVLLCTLIVNNFPKVKKKFLTNFRILS